MVYDFDEELVFSGEKKIVVSDGFTNGKIHVVCGGADVDMTKVITKAKDVYLDASAVLGGIKVNIPKDWIVDIQQHSVMGGVYAEKQLSKKGKVTLHVKGQAVLGGIAIV